MSTASAPEQLTDTGSVPRLRLDKYLWFARVVKSRTLAAKLISGGNVRVNSERTTSPAKSVAPGDVLTISLERTVRVLRIMAPGTRRGPFEEARLLYEEILQDPAPRPFSGGMAYGFDHPAGPEPDKTRPDKRARREGALMKRTG